MCKTQVMLAIAFSGFLAMTGQEAVRAQEGAPDPAPRTWTSRAGGYTIKATLLKFKDGVVQLQRQDGSVVSLAIEKLSEADQEFVRQRVPGSPKDDDPFHAPGGKQGATSEIERAATTLCEQIDKSYRGNMGSAKPRIAVVEFSDLSGKVTDFGRMLSEELITKLFSTGKYSVVERFLLNKAIAEHKLKLQGIVDPNSAKELGKILGVDAIVSGTMGDIDDTTRVNARLISTETGEIFSVAAVTISRQVLGVRPPDSPAPELTEQERGRLVFQEDFSRYEDGDLPDWGDHVRVQVGQDGRKWLMPSKEGMCHVSKKVSFPDDSWYLELNFTAQVRTEATGALKGLVTSSISLADDEGKQYRIGWQIDVRKHVFVLPDGTTQESGLGSTVPERGRTRADAEFWLKGRTLRIAKNGDVLRLSIDGKQVLTGDVKGFGRFGRFQVDVYGNYSRSEEWLEYLCFTNFKIGKLQ